MSDTICLNGPGFSLTGNSYFPTVSVNFSLTFDTQSDESSVLAFEWYLNGSLVSDQREAQFSGSLNCGDYTIGARILGAAGWSGVKSLDFYTCKVPLNTVIAGPSSIKEGQSATYLVLLNFSDGSVLDQTDGYVFTADYGVFDGNKFTVPANSTTHDSRIALVTATKGTSLVLVKEVTVLDATPLTLASLSIQGPDTVNEGDTVIYTVIAVFSDGSSQDVTPDYVFACPGGTFLGNSFVAFKNTVDGDTRASTITALKNGLPQLTKNITIADVKQVPGLITVDLFDITDMDVIGIIDNAGIGGGGLYAYTGKNIILPENIPANAYILASDKISQATSRLTWRFEFNIRKLVDAYPEIGEFYFTLKGRANTAQPVNGAFSLKSADTVMSMQGLPGSYIPTATGGSAIGEIVNYSSQAASGANGSHLPGDLPEIIKLTYHVASKTVTYEVPFVQTLSLSGPDDLSEGSSATFKVLAANSDGTTTDLSSTYTFTSTVGTFTQNVLTIAAGQVGSEGQEATITASKTGVDPLHKTIHLHKVLKTLNGPSDISEGESKTFTVIAQNSDGTTTDLSSQYTFTSTVGSFSGNVLTIATNDVVGDSTTATVTASKTGETPLTKNVNVHDTSRVVGVLVVDFYNVSQMDVIAYVDTSGLAVNGVAAHTGKNIIPEGIPATSAKDAIIIVSDQIQQTNLKWRFEFNLAKLIADNPAVPEFKFLIKGRSNVNTTLSGAFIKKKFNSTMVLTGTPGSYLPTTSDSDNIGATSFGNVSVFNGMNGSFNPADLPDLLVLTYNVSAKTLVRG